jgi:hypothetical protein
MGHATRTAFGQSVNLCDDARRFLLQRAIGNGGEGFTLRGFTATDVTCADCSTVLDARSASALPAPEVVQGPPVRSKLMDEIKRQMRVKYRLTHGIDLDEPEWASEDYRPLRNRR